ncbi:electron transfer flavoprotein alpha subunit apoprotein [Dethiosulfatibacter aminovorans DSM 17477]|uniref:Electron transfer flavoprotein alpha subunit apoprotein n=1 Tax=Dethiosulfatibacter aminovorans DSM 17477 TaxID=1121476 RepID=A0A1M6B439_9FIRM|nr:electron transfer flavoprotein subunit alpha [Dethiosulfatibacter aminovorans]SHI43509.1 electron transfer flavoprotein alpha subunit apoprotein [Dethiosulfatibacter aminovorans DSM 17477]
MSCLIIDSKKCVGCGICAKSCSSNALEIKNSKAEVNDNCVLCGVCLDACPFNALSIEKEENSTFDCSEYSDIWVFAEQHKGEVLPVSLELIGKGRELSKEKGCNLSAVLIGSDIRSKAEKLIAYGADKVYICNDSDLEINSDERYTDIFSRMISQYKPEILLLGATGFGRSLAPRIAARAKTGLTADCTFLEIDNETGLLHQTRPAFGGNLMATIICPGHRPQMATVRPGIMPIQNPDYSKEGEIISIEYEDNIDKKIKLIEDILAPEVKTIANAEIIVAVGRGIGSQKNIALAQKLASLLGGNIGVSRPLVDIGWSSQNNQIGQTGSSVSPKLLISCGISGAIQHLAGISGAKNIIAINTDPDAPIFNAAHYKVVGDCVEILKSLISKIEETGSFKKII